MPPIRRLRARLGALLAGLAVTGLGCGLFSAGALSRLDNAGLDFHFRHFATIPADPRIVLIEIDDSSLDAFGEWPWPRQRHAEIVRTLHEAGAKQIVYDIVFAEPTPPRAPQRQRDEAFFASQGPEKFIHDDQELSEAIAAVGNVYLATFGRLSPPGSDPAELVDRAMRLVRESPGLSLPSFSAAMGVGEPWAGEDFYHLVRVSDVLERGPFDLDPRTLVGQLDAYDPGEEERWVQAVDQVLPAAAKLAARRSMLHKLSANPALTLAEAELPLRLPNAQVTPERSVVAAAFDWARSVINIRPRLPAAPEESLRNLAHAGDLTPPIPALANAAAGFGLVTFEREGSGGTVREIPLLVEYDGRLLPQLGFAAALSELGPEWSAVVVNRELRITANEKELRIPIDESGSSLINWQVPREQSWKRSFEHVPASYVLEIEDLRRAIADNSRYFAQEVSELVRTRHADTPADYVDYQKLLERGMAIRGKLQRDEADDETELQSIDAQLRAMEQEAVTWVEHAWRQWEHEEPQNEEERGQKGAVQVLHARFLQGELHRDLAQRNERLQQRASALIATLARKVRGRICFVGYTASTVADFVSSPVYPSMPGVMAHANVANMTLQGKFARRARVDVRAGTIGLAGLLVTLLACVGGWRAGLLGMLAVLACLGIHGWWQFAYQGVYLSTPGAGVAAVSAWAATTALRQGTEERSRRRLQRALTQYTSPAIAAGIADRVGEAGLAPQAANVTCFFADLRNFTSLSERLGPERTRDLLNPYLEAVSDVLMAHGAIVNKFTGDGVFAFFNAPLHPRAEHARAACAASLATLEAVSRLNGCAANDGAGLLQVRLGLATGEAFVGDYGSRTKLDYTCIGDTVNVASRLEEANKYFGTRVLVNAATREAAGKGFAFRYLGRLLLSGKEQPVETYELLGTAAELDGPARQFVADFEAALGAFQAREWAASAEALDRCRLVRPHDAAVAGYSAAVNEARELGPREPWSGAVRVVDLSGSKDGPVQVIRLTHII